jgi:hypothetical protein
MQGLHLLHSAPPSPRAMNSTQGHHVAGLQPDTTAALSTLAETVNEELPASWTCFQAAQADDSATARQRLYFGKLSWRRAPT